MTRNHMRFRLQLFAGITICTLLFSSAATGKRGTAYAQGVVPTTPGIQPLAADGSSFHYYADGKRIDLTPSVNWVSVKFAGTNPGAQADAMKGSGAPLNPAGKTRALSGNEWTLVPVTAGTTQAALVQGINAMRAMPGKFAEANPVFQSGSTEMAVTDEFIAVFDATESMDSINATNAQYGAEIVRPILGQPNTFLMRVSTNSHMDALAMSNLYQDSGAAVTAAPNFTRMTPVTDQSSLQTSAQLTAASLGYSGSTWTPNDPWYSDQWSLNNTALCGYCVTPNVDINAPEAWAVTQGSPSVIIAVADSGVDLAQADLGAKLVAGHDSTDGATGGTNGAPCTPTACGNSDDARGTVMAGIAAAGTNNGIGIAGVCPGCRVMPVRIGYGLGSGVWTTNDAWATDGITWAFQNGASIIVSAWEFGSSSTVLNTAISNARTQGRGGRGTVVIFAAGDENTSVSYPANLSTVIAVGALNLCNARKQPATLTNYICEGDQTSTWGSNYGPELDISAPGVLLDSTDRTGTAGYSVTDYVSSYGSTAGAAAMVAGVAGLVLSVRSDDLSATNVQNILQNTAVDVAPAGFDNATGYGRVNAYNAVSVVSNIYAYIGGNLMGGYYVAPMSSTRPKYAQVDSGPVKVVSTKGASIVAAIRDLWSDSTHKTSSIQVMGMPASLLSTSYYFPAYNNVSLDDQIRFGNVGTAPTWVTVTIAGVVKGTYWLAPSQSQRVYYAGVDSGPVVISSSGGVPIIASIRDSWKSGTEWTSYAQLMGLPASLLSTSYYFPAYNNVSLDDQIRFGNVGAAPTWVTVTIAGVARGTYYLLPSQSLRVAYAGVDSGPVVVSSSGGVPIIASIRDSWWNGTAWTSYAQLMGLPASQLSDTYHFPAYDNVSLDGQLRFGNVGASPTTVTVTIGGVGKGSYYLLPSEAKRVSYAGLDSGPVKIQSSGEVPIIASLRDSWWDGTTWTSYAQLMGLPNGQLSTSYYFPAYNNVNLDDQLRLAVP